ncbi:MAG: hypothetical protein FWH40_04260, partial [Coriobacteriia bacterium]|nr:hypothetical protein [Coriobacteriia bacterium]
MKTEAKYLIQNDQNNVDIALPKRVLQLITTLIVIMTLLQSSNAYAASPVPSGFTDVTGQWGNKTVTIQSVENGRYVAAELNTSGVPLRARTAKPDTWEQYQTTLTADGWLGFRSVANKMYVSARIDSQQAPLRACAGSLQSWECFRVYQSGSSYYLLSQANGKWVQADVGQPNAPVKASAAKPSTWERFKL